MASYLLSVLHSQVIEKTENGVCKLNFIYLQILLCLFHTFLLLNLHLEKLSHFAQIVLISFCIAGENFDVMAT